MSSNSIHQIDEGILSNFDPALVRSFELAEKGHTADPSLVDYSKVNIRKDSLLLSGDGAFYTLQGEGPTIGKPAVFLRLHVCNLACTWCDAYYTWNPQSKEFWTEGKRVSFEDTAQLLIDTWKAGSDRPFARVVITGGEPLIQRKQIEEVQCILCNYGYSPVFEFETNGTLMPTETQLHFDQFNCSPKLANSDNNQHQMFKPKVIEALNEVNTTFKFVCMTNADLAEIEKTYGPYIDEDKIIIMPQGVTKEEVAMNAENLVDEVMRRGWWLLPRLQNICWDGARRGV